MTAKQCPVNPDQTSPCAHAKAIMWTTGTLIILAGFVISWQSARISAIESRGDTIIELRTDMSYVKRDVSEIKDMLRKTP